MSSDPSGPRRHDTHDTHDTHDPADPWSAIQPRVLLLGVACLVAVVFLPTLGFGFVYDDHWVVLDNGFLRTPADLPLLLRPTAFERNVPDAVRPMSVVFEAGVYALFGLSELAHHAVSVTLYVGLVVLVALWLAGLGAPLALRVATAAVFGTMAIHAEAVAVVSYREDLLAAVLGLGALASADAMLARPPRSGRRAAWGALAWLLMLLGVAAKQSAAPLPLLWLFARLLTPWRARPPTKVLVGTAMMLASAVLAVLLLHWHVLGSLSPYGTDTHRVFAHRVGWPAVWAASLQIHLDYLGQMVWPTHLSPEYVDFGSNLRAPATMIAGSALVGLLGIGLAAAHRRRSPITALAILGAFCLALPTSNLAPMPTMRADRFMLLASLPVALGMAAAALAAGARLRAARNWERGTARLVALAPLLAIVVVQGAAAQGAAAAYRSDTRLWSVAMARSPHSARAHGVYGELVTGTLAHRADPQAELNLRIVARTHCELARRFDPRDPIGDLCLGRLAATERDWARAYGHIERAAAKMEQRRERAELALASLALDLPDVPYPQRLERALAHLERAQRTAPYVAEVHAVAARIHHRLGQPAEASALYTRARSLRPERWDLALSLLELQLDLGHASAARATWSEARSVLRKADPIRRAALRRRLDTASRLFGRPDSTEPRPHES